MITHDHNFKNLFQDFPRETLEWLFPCAEQNWGKIKSIDFTRQEPKKHHLDNPVVKILLPKMNYTKEERIEVILQSYKGLFQLATRGLFDKYVDFIDVYSEISDQEHQLLYETIIQNKETIMLSQYIKEKGRQEGRQKGHQEAGYGLSFNIIQTMKKNNLPDDEIARLTNLDIEIVKKIIKGEVVDIPLHLLEPHR